MESKVYLGEDRNGLTKAGLELRDPPASTSRLLGLKACATTARPPKLLNKQRVCKLFLLQ